MRGADELVGNWIDRNMETAKPTASSHNKRTELGGSVGFGGTL